MQEAAERKLLRAPCGRAAVSMSHANDSRCSGALQPHPNKLVESQWPLCSVEPHVLPQLVNSVN